MTEPRTPLPREEAAPLARVMLDRFAASPARWRRGDPLDPEFEPFRDLYGKIEDARATATPESCRALAAAIEESSVPDRDPHGRPDPRHPLRHHVNACHAVAETLLRDARSDADIGLAEAILKASPPLGWERPYFDLLAELFDDQGNAALAVTLVAEACRLADEERADRRIRRGLYDLRDLLTRTADEEHVPEPQGPIPEILTAVDVAALLEVSLVTVRRHLADGSIPSRKLGRQRYVMKADFLNLLSAKSLRRTRDSH